MFRRCPAPSLLPLLAVLVEVTAAGEAAVAGDEASEWMISEMDHILGLAGTAAGQELLLLLVMLMPLLELEQLVFED